MISAADLSRRLARDAEAVCRHYLSRGHRLGRYWIIGDVQNTPGRSLYVRLQGPDYGPGAAGKWTDAATGEHGDLLDLIARNRDLHRIGDAMMEAGAFLALPRPAASTTRAPPAPMGSPEAARRLFRAGRSISGSLAEAYLRARGITGPIDWPALRYHPSAYYRAADAAPREVWPALLAAITDLNGAITGILRTWLDRNGLAGAACRPEAGARPSAWQCRSLRHTLRDPRRRRRRRDHARAQIRSAAPAHGRRSLGQPPRRPRSAPCPAPSLCRAR